jgi:hypothetical protein
MAMKKLAAWGAMVLLTAGCFGAAYSTTDDVRAETRKTKKKAKGKKTREEKKAAPVHHGTKSTKVPHK